jgi:transcription termination factor Rho
MSNNQHQDSKSGGKSQSDHGSQAQQQGRQSNQPKKQGGQPRQPKKQGGKGNQAPKQGGKGGSKQQSRSSRGKNWRRRPSKRRHRRSSGQKGGGGPEREVSGLMELTRNGAGILRHQALARKDDPTIPVKMVREMGLRSGDLVVGIARGQTVQSITSVNGHSPENLADRIHFDTLTAVHPHVPIHLGTSPDAITGRLLDIIAPIGRGQRGLIVAPPKAGKTTILTDIATGVAGDPDIELIVCLVAERPEEVTELRRAVDGMILAADLDMPSKEHIRVAHLGTEHAKRLTEEGRHAVVLVDSLTRLARAHNLNLKGSSRTMSGGLDAAALHPVRQVFGAARATEEAGSLTMMATCLVDTGSKMDDVVYEEFKGTGNMEVHLDRKLAELRLYPAINIEKSGTRREELLLDPQTLQQVYSLRRKLAGVPADKALGAVLEAMRRQTAQEAVS